MTTRNHERMSSVDTAWLRMDGPGNSMMIVGVSATESPVRAADFRHMLEQRLLCFTRFRQRPLTDALGASWVEDDEFDLDAHVRTVSLPKFNDSLSEMRFISNESFTRTNFEYEILKF